ncbi:MAG: hypothetical protein Q9191_008345, partial [Dirinaria sp. TL-2023a]
SSLLTTFNATNQTFKRAEALPLPRKISTYKTPLATPQPVPGFYVLQASAGPAFRKQQSRRQAIAAQDAGIEAIDQESEKSYEGDLIASGQQPPLNAQDVDKTVAGRWYMILVYVLAGIIVLCLTFCVIKALCYRSKYKGMWW